MPKRQGNHTRHMRAVDGIRTIIQEPIYRSGDELIDLVVSIAAHVVDSDLKERERDGTFHAGTHTENKKSEKSWKACFTSRYLSTRQSRQVYRD